MAKKKKGGAPQVKISPERYVKERARRFPIVKCLINSNWKEAGEGNILIARQRPDGDYIIGMYLVDLYCMGVKDAFVNPKGTDEDIKRFVKNAPADGEMVEMPYEEAHNLIYGAIEFAEEGGIEPHPDFGLAEYVLEEDTDEIPLIEFEYGYKGKHLLVIGPEGRERKYISVLHKNLGDNYDVIESLRDDFDDYDDEDYDDESGYGGGYSTLPYTYRHPEFPDKLKIRNRWIAEAFYAKDNYYTLPVEVIERIKSLPKEEAVVDIRAIARYEMGRGYSEYDETGEMTVANDQSALVHSLVMLCELGEDEAIDTVFEIFRMPFDMEDYYFSDILSEYGGAMLYKVCDGDLVRLVSFLKERGLDRPTQDNALFALGTAVAVDPSRKEEVKGIIRQLFKDMEVAIPANEVWTDESAGFLISIAIDLGMKELLPDIKRLYDLDIVDKFVSGDYDEVVTEMNSAGDGTIEETRNYETFDPLKFYSWNHEWFGEEEKSLEETDRNVMPIDDVEFA